MTPKGRKALDRVLVERGVAGDLDVARALVAQGRVLVAGAPARSPTRAVAADEAVLVVSPPRYVGRGGEKLAGAIDGLGIEVAGRRALDVGSSTGGFTDCLLARGAVRVLAVDVGRDQLHERLRADERVVVMEQTNVRDLSADVVAAALGAAPDVAVVDLSFTSLEPHVARIVDLVATNGDVVVLVKPQFEADRVTASRGRGVIRDPAEWRGAVTRVASALGAARAGIMGVMASTLRGTSGNAEFFVHARSGVTAPSPEVVAAQIDRAIETAATP